MNKLTVSIIVLLFAVSCNQLNDTDEIIVNSSSLRSMVMKAISGDSVANNLLSGFINLNLPVNKKFNKLILDSTESRYGSFNYSILLEYPNPVYNVFGVFDTQLNAMIIDRSLNGYLELSTFKSDEKTFIKIVESFLSKDIFELNRLTLYEVDSANVNLIFRTYTRLRTPENEYTQTVTELNDDRIKTSISSSKYSSFDGKGDVFLFDTDFRKYISGSDIFSGFVRNEVKLLSYPYDNKIFSDYESAVKSTLEGDDTAFKIIDADIKNYNITFTPGWVEDSSYTIVKNVKTALFGSSFKNKQTSSLLCIAPLAIKDSSENYSLLPLKNTQAGEYNLRYSDRKDNGATFLQYFEYSFCNKKFLIIFEAAKQGYDRHKTMYEKVINSFTIDC
ncbi:MAG: hypothetical protein IPM56_07070 [Ignavibacteriales bacterium]|nr:MAG: hypothetical protein IPM56_07070 [Ignavibacteriales bacterium]